MTTFKKGGGVTCSLDLILVEQLPFLICIHTKWTILGCGFAYLMSMPCALLSTW